MADTVFREGDSAGGNLALSLTRYLVQYQDDHALPDPPGALLLLSPYVDVGLDRSDPVQPDFLQYDAGIEYGRLAYTGPLGLGNAELNPYISPASRNPAFRSEGNFVGFPRTFISSGGAETLAMQIRTFADRMQADMSTNGPSTGDNVVYFEAPYAVHDYIVFGYEPETTTTLQAIRNWLEK